MTELVDASSSRTKPQSLELYRREQHGAWQRQRDERFVQTEERRKKPLAERRSLRDPGDHTRAKVRRETRRLLWQCFRQGRAVWWTDDGIRGMMFVDGEPWAGDRSVQRALAYFERQGWIRRERGRFAHEGHSPSRRVYPAGAWADELKHKRQAEQERNENRIRQLCAMLRARNTNGSFRLSTKERRAKFAELAKRGLPRIELERLRQSISEIARARERARPKTAPRVGTTTSTRSSAPEPVAKALEPLVRMPDVVRAQLEELGVGTRHLDVPRGRAEVQRRLAIEDPQARQEARQRQVDEQRQLAFERRDLWDDETPVDPSDS